MYFQKFSALPKKTQDKLATLSAAVDGVVPEDTNAWEIDISTLPFERKEPEIVREISRWVTKNKLCIYLFECKSTNIDLADVERAFATAKAHETNSRAYPRLNTRSRNFYVGSSQSVAKRLKEHLGYGSDKTYALQLIHWARPLTLKLNFVCAKYPIGTSIEIIQSLEDTLWESLKPMFGRQGRK